MGSLRAALGGPDRVVVVSGDGARRRGWAEALEAEGISVIRCVGQRVTCALVEGQRETCPLIDEAGVAVYDVDVLSPRFVTRLSKAHPRARIVYAVDDPAGGRHRPRLLVRGDDRILPPPPRAISEEEAELEMREVSRGEGRRAQWSKGPSTTGPSRPTPSASRESG